MYGNQNDGQDRCDWGFNAGISVCCSLMVGALVLWNNTYANADEFAAVPIGETADINIHADSQPLAVQNLEDSELVEANDRESKPVDIDPASSDVVQLDASQGDQHSQLDLAGSRDMQSLDVVDTGASVKFTHTADDIAGGVDAQQANVESGGQSVTGLNDMIEQQDDQLLLAGIGTDLPVTNTADARSQLNDVSNDVASEESAGLPYAVVLALLALIGLVPVARRNDHHHV